jgi:osmotically inducible protein OsmC
MKTEMPLNWRTGAVESDGTSAKARAINSDNYFTITGGSMKRNASAVWQGGLKDGKGTISTDSGVLSETQYSFSTRFEDGKGTNPEELIAAAHAGCFSMALSGQLGNAGLTAESIRTTASVRLEKTDAGFAITSVHLDVTAKVPGADQQAFETAANNAKAGCPVSKVLNAQITMEAKLEA